MLKSDLGYDFPESLVAQTPVRPSRILLAEAPPREVTKSELLAQFAPGDLLVINETKVLKRRIFGGPDQKLEIVFLQPLPSEPGQWHWQVLFPCQKFKLGDQVELPEGLTLRLLEKGRPQIVALSRAIDEVYFHRHGELPIPPYIQKARSARHNLPAETEWYQTAWAKEPGSLAAPTASLHFEEADLQTLRERGVSVQTLVLHVGLGTFLPLTATKLDEHEMHAEFVEIPKSLVAAAQSTRDNRNKVWALGTTVARALESQAAGLLREDENSFVGQSNLFIYPPYIFRAVDVLLTNFHQPESTLLALVFAFAGINHTRKVYEWAIAKQFRLFSYGDLSVWKRSI